jgi:hypothetical protein
VILGEHQVGWGDALTVTPGNAMIGQSLMTIQGQGHHQSGIEVSVESYLDRRDIERLRDLCDEALS